MKNWIELKHLSPYLPYNIKFIDIENKDIYEILTIDEDGCALYSETMPTISFYIDGRTPYLKPILRPLSDLAKYFFENNVMYQSTISNYITNIKLGTLNYLDFTHLLENHFDVFGLIDTGLAIDINKI